MTLHRRATAGDLAAALELWRLDRAAQGRRPPAVDLAHTGAQLSATEAVCVVAVEHDSVVGFALGRWAGPAEPGLLRLSMLTVRPDRRRQGRGGALLEALADTCYPKGARRLSAAAGTPAATGFLAACGLQSAGQGPAGLWVADLDPPVRELAVREGAIRLGQLLKLAGLVDTGAQGKALLAAGEVQVNGEVDVRRGRQLAPGDTVVVRDAAVRVTAATG